jgi:hypothetical protein
MVTQEGAGSAVVEEEAEAEIEAEAVPVVTAERRNATAAPA